MVRVCDIIIRMDSSYTLIRSKRRTLSVEIKEDGSVLVRAPKRVPLYEIDQFVSRNSKWISDHVAKVKSRKENTFHTDPITKSELDGLRILAEAYIPGRVEHFAQILNVTYGRVSIRAQKSLWGSCNTKGNLSFNCLLMKAPGNVRDYVIVHELCHRLEMNHSAAFWKHVESVIPDCGSCRRWLREEGRTYLNNAFREGRKS